MSERKTDCGPDNVKFNGRWCKNNNEMWTGWGCSGLEMNFRSTSLAIDIDDNSDIYWQYRIDEGDWRIIQFAGKQLLADGLSTDVHQLQLFRRTEGALGISRFKGVWLAKNGKIAPPPKPQKYLVEFVGDSITAGFRNSGPDWRDEDSWQSYAGFLARELSADWSTVAISGIGVLHNYAESWPPVAEHLQDYYCRTMMEKKDILWQPLRKPDMIILAVGTNDFTDVERQPTATEFIEAYRQLVKIAREKNPQAWLVVSEPVPQWAGERCREWLQKLVDEEKKDDSKIIFLPLNATGALLMADDFVDVDTHPNIKGGKKVAAYMYKNLKQYF